MPELSFADSVGKESAPEPCSKPGRKRIPTTLKSHYHDVVDLSGRLSRRLFSRSQRSYNVQRRHQSLYSPRQPSDSWVTVHNLRQLDGGILDPDDRLHDVADDREQIIAIYDEASKPQQGDGTSASDESENNSPNIFASEEHKFQPFSRNGIEITGEELQGTLSPLHVRRGSEPALNRLSPIPPYAKNEPPDPCKRWSAAPVIEDQAPPSSTPRKDKSEISPSYKAVVVEGFPGERGEGSGEEKLPSSSSASSSASSHHSATTTTLSRFTRDGNRCSVQILSDNPNMGRWEEAADRVIEAGGFLSNSECKRREPLGGASTPMHSREASLEDSSRPSNLVCLKNDGSPLGIHVIPSADRSGYDQGLLVEGIEPDGRVARDSRINVHDVIVEINGSALRNITFHQAQEIFKDAMRDPELQLRIVRKDSRNSPMKMVQVQERLVSGSSKVANVTQTRKTPMTLSSRTQAVMLQSNTRRIGKRLTVNLSKGPHGLGFSITTRDNPAGGEAPIYIKNILPKGAAIEEGTLRIGDRLLEVNGVQVTGYSQSEVANLLRQIPVRGVATLVVSRQEKLNESFSGTGTISNDEYGTNNQPPSPKLPRQLPSERITEDSLLFPWKQRDILTFEIPVHDSERAGLGVSVKGKTSSGPNGSVDLGIFVKNVIHGGAASRDGRLKQNDQLVNINGLSLLGKSNSEAMKTLRTAMHQEQSGPNQRSSDDFATISQQDQNHHQFTHVTYPNCNQAQQFVVPTPGKITLTVARRVDGIQRDSRSEPTTPDHSGTSGISGNTVVFNSKKEFDMERSVEGCLDFGSSDTFQMNNPVIQRLTGNNNVALRNESYYKATHDTWNVSQHTKVIPSPVTNEKERLTNGGLPLFDKLSSPTVNPPSRDTVLIHEEYEADQNQRRSRIPVSSPGGVYSESPSQSIDAYVSQTSLEESGAGFSRDQFGRQSMSEKRHATLDAKNTDTYQRNKRAREEREKYRQMYAEMELNSGATNPRIGVREVPVDVPSSIDPQPSEINLSSSDYKRPENLKHTSDTHSKLPPSSPVSSHKSNSPSKNSQSCSPSLEKLKQLAKFADLKSYTGKSLTLQHFHFQRPIEDSNSQLRSFRSPSKTPTSNTITKSHDPLEEGYAPSSVPPFVPPKDKQHTKVSSKTLASSHTKEIKKGSKSTFGQELSTIIQNWAQRNRELLLVNRSQRYESNRSSSDESLTTLKNPTGGSSDTHCAKVTKLGVSRGMSRPSKDIGPGLGMRKSSSLESLQTMVQEMALEDEGQRSGSGRVPRGRGCNESFRAAVDRSYDAPLAGAASNQMETLAEEGSESSSSGFGRGNSRQSSVSSSAEDKLKKGMKKKQGILKGLGNMFRFGKHRKSLDNPLPEFSEVPQTETTPGDSRRVFPDGGEKPQDPFRKLDNNDQSLCNMSGVTLSDDESQSRSERMHQLRAEHQRRHAQRNGTYPTDDMEERYDHAIKQRMGPMPPEPKAEIQHIRSRSYDFYGESKNNRRPAGFSDPNKFSHYVNYEQIQMHLRKNKEQERLAKLASQQYQDFRDKQTNREQREYQSQRCARENSYQQRPVSNYFEYESVQAVMNHAQKNQQTNTSSLSRRSQQTPTQYQPRSNSQNSKPIEKTAAAAAAPQQHSLNHPTSFPSSGASAISTHSLSKSQSQNRILNPPPLFSHSRGPPPPLPQSTREGVYAASGFRPASQFNPTTLYHHKSSLNHNQTLTVPGSKV